MVYSELLALYDDEDTFNLYTGFINRDGEDMTHILEYIEHVLVANTLEVVLSPSECAILSYNSQLFSDKVYGTPDMSFILEYMNGFTYTGDFKLNPDTVYKVFDPNAINTLMQYWTSKHDKHKV